MVTKRSMTSAGILLLALALLVTGCSSAGSKSAAKKAPAASASAGTAPGGGSQSAFCAEAKKQLAELGKVFPKDFTDPAQLKAYGEHLKSSYARLSSVAPPEISADIAVMTRVTGPLADAYVRGSKPTSATLAPLRSPEFQASAKRVAAYAQSRCGINPSSPIG